MSQLFRGLIPALQPYAWQLYELARKNNLRPVVTSVFRTYATQKRLYDAWKRGKSIYPAAVPGTSKHEKGLAFDLKVSSPAAQDWLGHVWEKAGGRWGGRFRDPIHFEI